MSRLGLGKIGFGDCTACWPGERAAQPMTIRKPTTATGNTHLKGQVSGAAHSHAGGGIATVRIKLEHLSAAAMGQNEGMRRGVKPLAYMSLYWDKALSS
jgi:hypothetical protein